MGSICNELLQRCLSGEDWSHDLLHACLLVDDGREFVSVVIERLGDLFELRLCDTYRKLFPQVVEILSPELVPRVRQSIGLCGLPGGTRVDRVYVLSRITLGADVAVTSVLLDAAKRRFPEAEIVFVAPRKNYEIFEADQRIRHLEFPYARSAALVDRLRASASLWLDDGLVIDPDSRLTQLGMIAVCPESSYLFFESRSYGGESLDRLPDLAARWATEVLGSPDARPFMAPLPPFEPPAEITVSLGVGENPAKRIGGDFERELMRALARSGASVLADKGGSEEERRRVESVLEQGMRTHDGSFAPFAAQIARSNLFIGYDSAGGHVASACGIPQIAIMNGFVSERMLARWRPDGVVIRGDRGDPLREIQDVLQCRIPIRSSGQ